MYMHMHTHIYIYTYTHIYTHIYIYIDTYTHTYIYMYIHTHIYTYIYIYTCMYICNYICNYICTCTYIHIYIYIHIYLDYPFKMVDCPINSHEKEAKSRLVRAMTPSPRTSLTIWASRIMRICGLRLKIQGSWFWMGARMSWMIFWDSDHHRWSEFFGYCWMIFKALFLGDLSEWRWAGGRARTL